MNPSAASYLLIYGPQFTISAKKKMNESKDFINRNIQYPEDICNPRSSAEICLPRSSGRFIRLWRMVLGCPKNLKVNA